jgi:HEAT repeat protein
MTGHSRGPRLTTTLLAGLTSFGCCLAIPPASPNDRAAQIRYLIKDNLHVSAHFVCAADARTIAAVRSQTSTADVPHFISLLGDKDHVVGMAAALVLQDMGSPALQQVRAAAQSSDPRVRMLAHDLLAQLELSRSTTQSSPTPERNGQ